MVLAYLAYLSFLAYRRPQHNVTGKDTHRTQNSQELVLHSS
jgi:hypothetical protein